MACNNVAVLHADGLYLSIDGEDILHNVSLSLYKGQIMSVVGPNGAGKSTLIKVLSNEISPNQGTIVFNGERINTYPPRERATHMAVLPQFNTLSFPFTVQEVIMLGRTPHETPKNVNQAIADEVLQLLGLVEYRKKIYTRLSVGEKQRVQLARVLVQIWQDDTQTPRVLMLDEPLAALDLKYQHDLKDIIGRVTDKGVAVLMVMHDINYSIEIADKLLALKDGNVEYYGLAEKLVDVSLLNSLYGVNLESIKHPSTGRTIYL